MSELPLYGEGCGALVYLPPFNPQPQTKPSPKETPNSDEDVDECGVGETGQLLSKKNDTHKPVKARFWPWLELFSVRHSLKSVTLFSPGCGRVRDAETKLTPRALPVIVKHLLLYYY